ncbi:MAG TPA: alpha/beta fold hydrolase, partial [Longimicrobiales bacterium]|nr:alpha/beta fold hydrolase [Longimicrobiales bacterium]
MERPDTTGQLPAWLDREAYPFANHWVTLSGGRRMHYVDEGDGETLLFVHGTPTWSFEWRHLIRAFSEQYRCIAPDLIGMGLSSRPDDFAYTPAAHADVLREFVGALGLNRFTLIVHDFGGPIALPLALDPVSRAHRLVLINTWMWSFAGDGDMEKKARMAGGNLGRFLYRWANASLRMIAPSAFADRRKLTPAIHHQYLSVFPDRDSRERVLWTFARALLGSSDYYTSLWERRAALTRIPVLIIWGMKDPAFAPNQLQRWREALPNAQV